MTTSALFSEHDDRLSLSLLPTLDQFFRLGG
jgi:hypothetical protein